MAMSKPVTKAVIAAAGFGTRFLPQTKAMPKEMLPVIDKPIIQYVVEELVEAGIKDIIIITGYSKRSIEDHFDTPNEDLLVNLRMGGVKKEHQLHEIEALANLANFIYVRQRGSYGTAAPIRSVKHLIGDEPFIYTFADDFFDASPSRTKQLIEAYNKYNASVFACKRVLSDADYDRYGIVGGKSLTDNILEVDKILEAPGKAEAPSDLASVSGYLLMPEIFNYIDQAETELTVGTEFRIQPIMQKMIDDGIPFIGCEIKNGTYHDTGNKLEYLKTVVEFAIKHQDLGPEFREFLRGVDLGND
jgi:UTP--glucose-1-phosphate uridylyltransferase